MKPKLFIGSSAESVSIAYAAQQNLHHNAEVTVWDQGVFKLSATAVESLLEVLGQSDFGMFVFSPDDLVNIRGESSRAVRDNVLFELGLFLGRLGRERCFILVPEGGEELRIATDLIGIAPGTYETDRSDGSWQAATGPACNSIREAIRKTGPRLPEAQAPDVAPKQEDDTEKAQIEAGAEEAQAGGSDTTKVRLAWAWLDAYFDRDYPRALRLIQERISTPGEDGDLMFLQGWVGRIKYAIDPREGTSHFEEFIRNHPQSPDPYAELANCHMGRDLYPEALEVLERGLGVVRDRTFLIIAKANCLKELGRPDRAGETLEGAIAESPTEAGFYLALGKHYVEEQNYAAARTWLERGSRELPDQEGLLSAYATILRDHFDKTLALVPLGKLLLLKPESSEYLALRANILLELDINGLAMRDYQRANELAKEEQGWILGNIGNLYKNRGLHGDAIRYLKKALEREPDSQYAHERLASAIQLSQQENEKLTALLKEARLTLNRGEISPAG